MGMKNRGKYAKHKPGDRVKYATDCGGAEASMTKQEFRKETDINYIVNRYVKNGMPAPRSEVHLAFQDCTLIPDYQGALDIINKGAAAFLELPPKVRERFGNEPARLVEFLQNDSNRAEAEFLGLVEKKAEPVSQDKSDSGGGAGSSSGK